MTDTQKIEALTELIFNVIHSLNMKSYDIDDPTLSHQCEIEADEYHNQTLKILHGTH